MPICLRAGEAGRREAGLAGAMIASMERAPRLTPPDSRPLLLYDGECGLCDRTVQTILDLDRVGVIRLAALQGETGREVLLRHGLDPSPADGFKTLILVTGFRGPRERLRKESSAVLQLGRALGGRSRVLARFGECVPSFMRDAAYRLVARNRHSLFPPPDTCRLPTPEVRARFLP